MTEEKRTADRRPVEVQSLSEDAYSSPDGTSARKPDETDKLVGARLMQLRKAKGITQNELGKVLGVRFQQIQRYESGKNRIGPSRLSKSAELLGVKLEYFFADEGIFESFDLTSASALASEVDRVVELFSMIDNSDLRRSVISILEGLVASKTGSSS